jgi:5'-nucleotidase
MRAFAAPLLLAALLTGAAGSSLAAAKAPSNKPITLSLIALNDFHGNILPPSGSVLVPDPDKPEGSRVSAGGAAYLASLVHQLKSLNPRHTLVVAAGDMLGASPLTSGLFHDEPTIEVLDAIGLDIASVGNHEFDKGRLELLRLQHGGCFPKTADGSVGVVGSDTCMNRGRFSGAHFQYLAANVIDQQSKKPLLPAYAIKTVGGVKIAFIGLTLKDTPTVVTPAGVAGLDFKDEVETVNALVPELRHKGATVIVVLIHQGGQTTARKVLDKSCLGFSGEIVNLADRFDSAVDVVVSGHTHQEYVCFRPDGKLVTQTGSYGRLVTKIDLTVDARSKRVIAKDANNQLVTNDVGVLDAQGAALPLPRGYQALPKDPKIAKIVQRYGDLTASVSDLVVGRVAEPLDRKPNAAGESRLGAFIADVFLAGSSDSSYGDKAAQIAFTNPGGLRSDLSASAAVTFGQLFNVLPFNNNLVTMTLTGDQIRRLLELQWEKPQPLGGRILSVSQGFSYAWDAQAPEGATAGTGARVVPGSIQLQGEPLDMQKDYRVTVNNFMASGGDNFPLLRDGRDAQSGEIDLVVAKLYLRAHIVVKPPEAGRITRLH